MTTKRIIACLDVKGANVVKGVNFLNLQFKGDPVSLASLYEEEGADENSILRYNCNHRSQKSII